MMIINVFLLSVLMSRVQTALRVTRRRPGKTSCHDWDDSPSSSHGGYNVSSEAQARDNVPTIAMTKIHNFIFARDKIRRIGAAALVFSNGFDDSNSPICVCMLACTSGTLLKEMHNVCKRDWEVGAGYTGHRPVVSQWGNIQIQLLFSRPSRGQTDWIISMINVNPMLFTLEVYSKTNMVNLNNKNPSNAWPGVIYSPQCARNEF